MRTQFILIQLPVLPRKKHNKETTAERNERRKRSKKNKKGMRHQVSGTGNLGLPRPFIGSWRSKFFFNISHHHFVPT